MGLHFVGLLHFRAADVHPEFARAQTVVADVRASVHDERAEIYAWEATRDLKPRIRTFSSPNCYFCQLKRHGRLCECVSKGIALDDYEKVSICSELGRNVGVLLRTSSAGHIQGWGTGQTKTRSDSGNSQGTTASLWQNVPHNHKH